MQASVRAAHLGAQQLRGAAGRALVAHERPEAYDAPLHRSPPLALDGDAESLEAHWQHERPEYRQEGGAREGGGRQGPGGGGVEVDEGCEEERPGQPEEGPPAGAGDDELVGSGLGA